MKPYILLFVLLMFVSHVFTQTKANLLGTWDNPALIGSNTYDNTYNEIWGVAINGVEYAIIGSTAGTHFINISNNPTQPFEEHFIEGAVSNGQIIHRDYHDYNGFLYAVADEGESSLQIIDLRCLPNEVNVVYDSKNLIKQAHNIFIDEAKGNLYAFATRNGDNSSNALRIFSLENPINPVLLAEHRVFDGITIGHVHDGWVDNDLAFLNCGGDALFIVDFSDPQNPITKDKLLSYPDQGYNHSGWPTDDLQYYYMADENHGKDLKVIDISDIENISVEGTFNAEVSNVNSITHNQIVNCNYLYTSYYYDGLQVFDISDPKNPKIAYYYDTYDFQDGTSYKGAWGIYPFLPSGKILISDMQSGLFVFESIDSTCENNRSIADDIANNCVPTSLTTNLSISEVYPNPVASGEYIYFELFSPLDFLSLTNTTGQQVIKLYNLQEGEHNLSLPNELASGVYFFNAYSAGNIYETIRILVQ